MRNVVGEKEYAPPHDEYLNRKTYLYARKSAIEGNSCSCANDSEANMSVAATQRVRSFLALHP